MLRRLAFQAGYPEFRASETSLSLVKWHLSWPFHCFSSQPLFGTATYGFASWS